MKYRIIIDITKADLKTLKKYGFMIEKNTSDYLKEIAQELRALERENLAKKNGRA